MSSELPPYDATLRRARIFHEESDSQHADRCAEYIRHELKQESRPPIFTWPDPYTNKHVVYITEVISKDGAPVRSSGSLIGLNESFITGMTGLGPQTTMLVAPVARDYLRLIEGFQDCGVTEIARADLADIDDVRNLLSAYVFDSGVDDMQPTDVGMRTAQPSTVAEGIASSGSPADASQDGAHMLELHVCRIHLYSKCAEGLLALEPSDIVMLLFRWSKVHAVYGQPGTAWWKPDLAEILREAEFRAGDGLKLSVLGVSEEQWDRYRLDGGSEMVSM